MKIALVGKYTKLEDSYISVIKALKHAALSCRLRLKLDCIGAENLEEECRKSNPIEYHEAWKTVSAANGIIVPGGFGTRGIEGKILAANSARERKVPYLGEFECMCVYYVYMYMSVNIKNFHCNWKLWFALSNWTTYLIDDVFMTWASFSHSDHWNALWINDFSFLFISVHPSTQVSVLECKWQWSSLLAIS